VEPVVSLHPYNPSTISSEISSMASINPGEKNSSSLSLSLPPPFSIFPVSTIIASHTSTVFEVIFSFFINF
jgi:hypothetical protein